MNWLPNTLLSALLLLLTYQLLQQQQINARLDSLQQQQQDTASVLTDNLQPLLAQLTLVQTGIDKLSGKAEAANKAQLQKLSSRASLLQALADITLADLLLSQQQGTEAAETLKNTKKTIWTAGDVFSTQKKRLQDLMGPIDKRVAAWQKGELGVSAGDIRKELAAVLGEIK